MFVYYQPLKSGHLTNQDTTFLSKGVWIREAAVTTGPMSAQYLQTLSLQLYLGQSGFECATVEFLLLLLVAGDGGSQVLRCQL